MEKDYCTGFFEKWITWKAKIIEISPCCKLHDIVCSTTQFFRCLWKKKVVGTIPITFVAFTACWIRHTDLMVKRWKD